MSTIGQSILTKAPSAARTHSQTVGSASSGSSTSKGSSAKSDATMDHANRAMGYEAKTLNHMQKTEEVARANMQKTKEVDGEKTEIQKTKVEDKFVIDERQQRKHRRNLQKERYNRRSSASVEHRKTPKFDVVDISFELLEILDSSMKRAPLVGKSQVYDSGAVAQMLAWGTGRYVDHYI
ncbi:MAG: hypothetical protein R3Y53_07525 [Bacillota bacterium]